MLYELADGSLLALPAITAITPIFKPEIRGNDISKLDTRPRYQIFVMGGQTFTMVSENKPQLKAERDELIKNWEAMLTPQLEPEGKVN